MPHDILSYEVPILWTKPANAQIAEVPLLIRKQICQSCSFFKFGSPGGRYPYILPCSHSICQHCVSTGRPIRCSVCNLSVHIPAKRHYKSFLLDNFYLLGQSVRNFSSKEKTSKMTTTAPRKISLDFWAEGDDEDDEVQSQCVECLKSTRLVCAKCDGAAYCRACFDKIHSAGCILKQHTLDAVEVGSCTKHNNAEKYLYCRPCDQPICDACQQEHTGHDVITIAAQNKSAQKEIRRLLLWIEKTEEQIDVFQEKIHQFEPTIHKQIGDINERVTAKFRQLHGSLQNEENTILKNIKKIAEKTNADFEKLYAFMGGNRKKLKKKKQELAAFENVEETVTDLTAFVRKIRQQCDSIPSSMELNTNQCLIKTQEQDSVNERVNEVVRSVLRIEAVPFEMPTFNDTRRETLNVNEQLQRKDSSQPDSTTKNVISGIIHEEVDTLPPASLSPKSTENQIPKANHTDGKGKSANNTALSTWPDRGWTLPKEISIWNQLTSPHQQATSTADILPSPTRLLLSKSIIASGPPSAIVRTPARPMVMPLQETVYVTYIRDPGHFYVQNVSNKKKIDELKNRCLEMKMDSEEPAAVKIGQRYLVRKREVWYRGDILAKHGKDDTDSNFDVLLIDVGMQCVIPKNKIRIIPDADWAKEPAKSYLCSLYNLVPTGDAWSTAATKLMEEIHSNNPMILLRNCNNMEVDLITTKQVKNISVRDSLIGLSLAKESDPKFRGTRTFMDKRTELISSNYRGFFKTFLEEGENYTIIVYTSESPGCFYVMKLSEKESFDEMAHKMHETYEGQADKIFVPKIGMICAVHDIELGWSRGCITNVETNGDCSVRLVDAGFEITKAWSDLRYLNDEFLQLNEGVVICKLSGIAPIIGIQFSQKCIEEFRNMVTHYANIHVHRIHGTMHEVTMTIFLDNVQLHVNSLLVEKGYALSTGFESLTLLNKSENVSKWLRELPGEKPIVFNEPSKEVIRFKKYIDPSHFYIQFEERNGELLQIQKQMQMHINHLQFSGQLGKHHDWKSGDMCSVRAALENKPTQWYRGLILEIGTLARVEYNIFLVDEAEYLNAVQHVDMAPLDDSLTSRTYAAVRCHLAMVGPTDGIRWSKSAIDAFLDCTKRFQTIAASMFEDSESKGIIVYGQRIINGHALSSAQVDWVNINDYLIDEGLMAATNDDMSVSDSHTSINTEHIIGLEYNSKCADALIRRNRKDSEEGSSVLDVDDEVVHGLGAWKPYVPIKESVLNVYVTYVDKELKFYLHNYSQKEVIMHISARINKKLQEIKIDRFKNWRIGQPCLAMFTDHKYYRAEVCRIDKKKQCCQVQFIDYGYLQTVHFDAMKNVTMFVDTPKQASCCYFRNLQPKTENKLWPFGVIDHCLEVTSNQLCSVRIDPGYWQNINVSGPIPFDISARDVGDLRRYLIVRGLAENIVTRRIQPELSIKMKVLPKQAESVSALPKTLEIDSMIDFEDFRRAFEQQEASDPNRRVGCNDYEKERRFDFFGDPIDSRNSGKRLTSGSECLFTKNDIKQKKVYGSFAYEKATDKVYDMILTKFNKSILNDRTETFYSDICKISSATNLIVAPHMHKHDESYNNMIDKIQEHIESVGQLVNVNVGMPCLAYSEEYKKWYRALVLDFDSKSCRIVFVDYMDELQLKYQDVRQCPEEYMDLSLRVIQVKLHAVQRNSRMRTKDIITRIKDILKDQLVVYVHVIKNGKTPEVAIFREAGVRELIYEPMFAERYFRKVEHARAPIEQLSP